MKRAGWWMCVAVPLTLVLAVPAAAAPLPDDKSALAQVPATAPLVVYLHGVEGTAGRLIAYLKNALKDAMFGPNWVQTAELGIKTFLETGADGRKLRGLVKEGPILVAFSEIPMDEQPKFAIIAAVTDYKAFRDGLLKDDERKALRKSDKGYEDTNVDGKPLYFVERKGYAVVTPDEKTAAAYAKKQPGLDTKISKEQTNRLLTSDLGIYLSMDVVNKDYAEQIKAAKEEIESFLKGAEEGLAKNQRGMIGAVRNLVGPVFQAIEDSKGVLLSVEFRPTALVLHVESELRPNTKTGALLKDCKPVALADLDRTPAGQVFYTAFTTSPEMFKLLGPLAVGAIQEPGTKEAKALQAALDRLAKAGPGTRVDVAGLPLSGVQTWQFTEPTEALAAQRAILGSLTKGDTFGNGMLKEKAPLKKGAAKYKSIEFDSMTLVWDLEKMAASAGPGGELPEDVQKRMAEGFKKILGEQTTVWIGADDKQLFTVSAPDWKAAEMLLDKYFSRTDIVSKKRGYLEARKELPAGATMVGLMDLVSYGTAVTEVFKPIVAGLGVPIPDKFPAPLPKGDPSFVGTAMTLQESRIAFDLVITASAVRDAYKAFVLPFLGLR
jgi:hypothetical protein